MGRTIRTRLPGFTKETQAHEKDQAREKAKKVQEKQKLSYDSKANIRENDIQLGDLVLLKQKKTKSKPPNDPDPYKVIQKWKTQLQIQRGNKIIFRDAGKLKKFQVTPKIKYQHQLNNKAQEQMLEWEEDTEGVTASTGAQVPHPNPAPTAGGQHQAQQQQDPPAQLQFPLPNPAPAAQPRRPNRARRQPGWFGDFVLY